MEGYSLDRKIEDGKFIIIYEATKLSTTEKVAIKLVAAHLLDEEGLERSKEECLIIQQLHHPNIVKLVDYFLNSRYMGIITEYCSGGNLQEYLNKNGKLKEPQSRTFFSQALSAIKCCHQNNVIHRDVKLENLVLDATGNVKLIDFNVGKLLVGVPER
jgi:serine/threonine protein kinase